MADHTTAVDESVGSDATEKFLERLRRALRRDGDFPASARTVSELRNLVMDPKTTGNQITEVILREPSLGTRILHLVNSSFYRRAKPIMTVSQAVIQIGMKPLAELCAGLVLLQKFVPKARRGGPFANSLQRLILTSLLSSTISSETERHKTKKAEETGYLAGCFSELGILLLAFYFPQVFESALTRATQKNQDLSSSIKQLTGLTPNELSIEVIDALELPPFYGEVLRAAEAVSETPLATGTKLPHDQELLKNAANAVYAAREISNSLQQAKTKQELDAVLSKVQRCTNIDSQSLTGAISNLPTLFNDHCVSIELDLPSLPEFVTAYSETSSNTTEQAEEFLEDDSPEQDQFNQFVQEIQQAVENREPTASVITTVMETCAWSLGFDRVVLLLLAPSKRYLVGRMLLGKLEGFDPTAYRRPLGADADPHAPDATAFREARAVFRGDPLFEGGWPIAAIPVGFGKRAIGVIYGEKVDSTEEELSAREQAAIGVLAELLDRSVASVS